MASDNDKNQEKDIISLKSFVQQVKIHWLWYLLSVAVCCGLAFVYLKSTNPVYERSTQLLIKADDAPAALGGALGGFSGFEMFNQSSNLYNELNVIKSPDLMEKVVKEMDLNNSYVRKKWLKKTSLYGDSIPLKVILSPEYENEFLSFKIEVDKDNHITLSNFILDIDDFSDEVSTVFDKTVSTPVGDIKIVKTPSYAKAERPLTILYSHQDTYNAALDYCERVSAVTVDNKSSIIELSIKDTSRPRADSLLRSLVKAYNDDWIEDKNSINESSSAFIRGRLADISVDLDTVDTNISNFKSSNLLPDLSFSGKAYFDEAIDANRNLLDINTQLYFTNELERVLKNLPPDQPIPAVTDFDNSVIAKHVQEYNTILLDRNRTAANSGTSNPLVADYDAQLRTLQTSILSAFEAQKMNLEQQRQSMQGLENKAVDHIVANPKQAKYLLSVEREQKVKQSIYIYLLQKLEENELSNSYSAFNNRIIKQPNGEKKPISPRKKVIMLAAFLIGLLIPYAFFIVRSMLVTTIQSRADIAKVKIPFLAEITAMGTGKTWYKNIFRKMRRSGDTKNLVVIRKGSNNVINESFRILRTNLSMMLGKDTWRKVVAITSFNPGSGKSFIAVNLGMVFGMRNSRCLVVDCDMRHASTSAYIGMPPMGLADYLSNMTDDIDGIIHEYPGAENLSIIPVGNIPPNPTELLENGRFENLMTHLRERFDYILLDCPPLGMLADTQIANHYADLTVLVIRAGLFKKDEVGELNELYQQKTLTNLALVLNGVDYRNSSYFQSGRNAYYHTDK